MEAHRAVSKFKISSEYLNASDTGSSSPLILCIFEEGISILSRNFLCQTKITFLLSGDTHLSSPRKSVLLP